MTTSRVTQAYKTTWHTNPLSGHTWPEHTPLDRWEVSGGFWSRTRHNSDEAAEREAEERNAFDIKYPFQCPRTAKEIAYVRRAEAEVRRAEARRAAAVDVHGPVRHGDGGDQE